MLGYNLDQRIFIHENDDPPNFVVNDNIMFDAKRWPTFEAPTSNRTQSEKLHLGKQGSDLLRLSNGQTISDSRIAIVFHTTYVLDKQGVIVFFHSGTVANWLQYLHFLHDVATRSDK